ncbi:PAS domain S-box protein [Haloplanus salilacus]|uniref:PAS domain S-box protein n=1 Tax=Haloplanus salilacus TaxID=2949994 RepID=UPI0030CB7FB8
MGEEGKWQGEMTVTTAAGRVLRQELTLTQLDDGRAVCVVRDITDRANLESELTDTVERYETLVENFPEGGVFLYNEGHECILAGGAGLSSHGLSTDEVVGSRPSDRYPPEIVEELEGHIRDAFEGAHSRFEQAYGDQYYRIWTLPVGDDEAPDHVMAVSQEITDRKEREQAIEDLHGTARSFIQAETSEEIADITVNAARDILDLPASSVHLYDEESDNLPPAAWTDRFDAIIGKPPTFSDGESLGWEVFESGEPHVYNDVSAAPGRLNPDADVGSRIILPLGDHGVFLIGSESTDAFDETDESLARTLATHATSAFTRIRQEQKLREERIFIDQALDTLADLFYVIEPDGTLRKWNDRFSEAVGYTDEQIGDMRAVDFFPEDDRERVADTIEEAVTTGCPSTTTVCVRRIRDTTT